MKKTGIVLAAVLAAAACRNSLDVGNYALDGQWRGRTYLRPPAETDSVRYDFTFTLTQNQHDVGGSATVKAAGDSVRTSVDGRWDYPDVTLSLTASDYAPLTFQGRFITSDSILGTLDGSGFAGRSFSIVRQR